MTAAAITPSTTPAERIAAGGSLTSENRRIYEAYKKATERNELEALKVELDGAMAAKRKYNKHSGYCSAIYRWLCSLMGWTSLDFAQETLNLINRKLYFLNKEFETIKTASVDLERVSRFPHKTTAQNPLSQGVFESSHYCLIHDQTMDSRVKYGYEANGDAAGVGMIANQPMGVVCDAIGARKGRILANGVKEVVLSFFEKHHAALQKLSDDQMKELALTRLFGCCAHLKKVEEISCDGPDRDDPGQDFDGIATTCVFARIEEGREGLRVRGAALGDSVAFRLQAQGARMLTLVGREDVSDPGGAIFSFVPGGEDPGLDTRGFSYFSERIDPQDFVILASDGLYDNLHKGQQAGVLAFVARSPFFDRPVTEEAPKNEKGQYCVPSLGDLQNFIELPPDDALTPKKISDRLNNYVKWVTAPLRTFSDVVPSDEANMPKPDDLTILVMKPCVP